MFDGALAVPTCGMPRICAASSSRLQIAPQVADSDVAADGAQSVVWSSSLPDLLEGDLPSQDRGGLGVSGELDLLVADPRQLGEADRESE